MPDASSTGSSSRNRASYFLEVWSQAPHKEVSEPRKEIINYRVICDESVNTTSTRSHNAAACACATESLRHRVASRVLPKGNSPQWNWLNTSPPLLCFKPETKEELGTETPEGLVYGQVYAVNALKEIKIGTGVLSFFKCVFCGLILTQNVFIMFPIEANNLHTLGVWHLLQRPLWNRRYCSTRNRLLSFWSRSFSCFQLLARVVTPLHAIVKK